MKNVVTFEVVMERLKQAFQITSDKEIAELLGMKPNAFYNRKRSRSIPYDEIIALADHHDMYIDWIIFGRGTPFVGKGESALAPISAIDMGVMASILGEIERASLGELAEKHPAGLQLAAQKGAYAAVIYNKVAFVKNELSRAATIIEEANSFATMARVNAAAEGALTNKKD